jgi:hypothetical protein
MTWDDRRPTSGIPKLDVASLLTHLLEAGGFQSTNRLGARDDRKSRAHAATSTEAMIGGSTPSGTGSSSK